MATLSPAIRSGPVLAAVLALALAMPAGARDAAPAHHYSVYGSLAPAGASAQGSGGAFQMQSRVSRPTATVVEQAGGDFVMHAKLADQPLVCYGDTIFRNGFDL
jgi:hypothetical protein